MKLIIEIEADGKIILPSKILEAVAPNKRFVVEVQNKSLILNPVNQAAPFWATATSQQRAERILQWTSSHQEGANLDDEALSRDNIYD